MNKEKQIEQIDCEKCLHYEACRIAFRNSKSLSIYEDDYSEEDYFADTIDCDYYVDKNIYRKADEIAEEIFAEIWENEHKGDFVILTSRRFAELKKKYKGDGE